MLIFCVCYRQLSPSISGNEDWSLKTRAQLPLSGSSRTETEQLSRTTLLKFSPSSRFVTINKEINIFCMKPKIGFKLYTTMPSKARHHDCATVTSDTKPSQWSKNWLMDTNLLKDDRERKHLWKLLTFNIIVMKVICQWLFCISPWQYSRPRHYRGGPVECLHLKKGVQIKVRYFQD